MKKTFTTVDVLSIVEELKECLIGLRVNQIYDIDHKTYLIKLQKPDKKVVLLLESSSRLHTTEYEWPKSPAPSGFAMKLRKHLRNKRLECVSQLGVDRVVDLTFGAGEAMHHLIIELYDRGNIVLTDGQFNILNVLRPRKEGEDTKIIVNQKYPIESARTARKPPTLEELEVALSEAKDNSPLKKILNPLLDCGGGVLEHELLNAGFAPGAKKTKDVDLEKVLQAVTKAQSSVTQKTKGTDKIGYIIKKQVHRTKQDGSTEEAFLFEEFHPCLYTQHKPLPFDQFESFNKACDEFFSKLEANELDKKAVQKERQVLKKLENVRKDHERRLQELKGRQEIDTNKGQLIELNQELVEGALLVVRSALANQIDWKHIQELLDEAQARGDRIACAIRDLSLRTNTMTLWLSDPYDCDENDMLLDSDEEREEGRESMKRRPTVVDIHLDLSSLANARRFYNQKRQAARKEQKTMDASFRAIRSAEKKTHQTLKEASAIATINKARKVHWFEKFLWFVSSENYLVLGGRDSQQNEQVVKRHLKVKDVYVHGDLHGAASVIVKNPAGGAVPPRTLHEAGAMALCYSRAWDERVVTSAWWVWGQQVSKSAPSGEYLSQGAFMVRGRKNFLPPSHLVYGFGLLFRLEESSVHRHLGERKVRLQDEEFSYAITEALEKLSAETAEDEKEEEEEEEEDEGEEGDDEDEENNNSRGPTEGAIGEVRKEEVEGSAKGRTRPEVIPEEGEGEEKGEGEEDALSLGEFPDTELHMSHLKGDQFTMTTKVDLSPSLPEKGRGREIFLGDDKPFVLSDKRNSKQHKNKHKDASKKESKVEVEEEEEEERGREEEKEEKRKGEKGQVTVKRGQKGKMKKMKKYKDQDEEERQLRMQLLQSAGSKKPEKRSNKKDIYGNKKKQVGKKSVPGSVPSFGGTKPVDGEPVAVETKPKPKPEVKSKEDERQEQEQDENEDDDMAQAPDDLSILNALTAIPVGEDELLYAVPVCAPYSSMANFKFKVKLTPGPGKKGKACKTAINLFLNDKNASGREKDLFRAIKDHDLAKNMPGKVKVSAPNISKIKK